MGQEEVIDYIKRHGNDWVTIEEIAVFYGLNKSSVLNSVRRLLRGGFLVCEFRKPEGSSHTKYFIKLKEE